MAKVGAVLGTKDENYKESFQNLQMIVLQYVVENYIKGVNLAPLINTVKEVDLTSKEPGPPTVFGSKGASDVTKKR